MTIQPESVQAIADRMAPIATKEGFAEEEWAEGGPAVIRAHIDAVIEGERQRLEAESAAVMKSGSFVTFRLNVASGPMTVTKAPEQGENRIIWDVSSNNQLEAYRGICHLLIGDGQSVLAKASEILIVSMGDSAASWIAQNKPHPIAPTKGWRFIIVQPDESDAPDHFDDLHHAAHLAVVQARRSAGLATVMWLMSGSMTRVGSPRARHGEVVSTAAGLRPPLHIVIGADHQSGTTDMLLGWSHRIEVHNSRSPRPGPIVIGGGTETTIISSGRPATHWMGVLKGRTFEFGFPEEGPARRVRTV